MVAEGAHVRMEKSHADSLARRPVHVDVTCAVLSQRALGRAFDQRDGASGDGCAVLSGGAALMYRSARAILIGSPMTLMRCHRPCLEPWRPRWLNASQDMTAVRLKPKALNCRLCAEELRHQ